MGIITIPGIRKAQGLSGYRLFPAGDYVMEIESIDTSPSKNNPGNLVARIAYKVIEGPPFEDGSPTAGQTFIDRQTIITPQSASWRDEWSDPDADAVMMAANYFKSLLEAAGYDTSTLNTDAFDTAILIGKQVRVTIIHQVDNRERTWARVNHIESLE